MLELKSKKNVTFWVPTNTQRLDTADVNNNMREKGSQIWHVFLPQENSTEYDKGKIVTAKLKR